MMHVDNSFFVRWCDKWMEKDEKNLDHRLLDLAKDPVEMALRVGFMAGVNSVIDGGDIFPDGIEFACLVEDYKALVGNLTLDAMGEEYQREKERWS